MNIAYVMAEQAGAVDEALAAFAGRLASLGVRTCGAVQINSDAANGGRCDMDVKILPDGPTVRISQSLGRHSRGCRLDPAALEEAVALTTARLERGADVLIVNKFGKHEADGRGFRDLIAEALSRGIPVVVGLNALNKEAFVEFAGDMAKPVPTDCEALLGWLMTPSDFAA